MEVRASILNVGTLIDNERETTEEKEAETPDAILEATMEINTLHAPADVETPTAIPD